MTRIAKTFLTGLITLAPILITVYLVYWLAVSLESAMAGLVRLTPLAAYYAPGFGVGAGVVVILAVGMLMSSLVARRLWAWLEASIRRVPVVRSIYGALRDFTHYFASTDEEEFRQVVELRFRGGARILAFLTRDQAPAALTAEGEEAVVVYVPMSYQIGGHTLVVPRDRVRPVDMSFEDAMRFVLTAGVGRSAGEAPPD
ncbi:MAG TPA: DUF502 domain-containing protein [Gammaproteobacteria bacterium]|nr:DUF502 domain-containing protein [Gammaproteobacteria bacterium]